MASPPETMHLEMIVQELKWKTSEGKRRGWRGQPVERLEAKRKP
jgi:hypothetical protein